MEYLLCLCLCVVVCGGTLDIAPILNVENVVGMFMESLDMVSLDIIENLDDGEIHRRETRDLGSDVPHTVWHSFQKDTKDTDRQYLKVSDASSSVVQLLGYGETAAVHWSFVKHDNVLIADNQLGLRIYNVTKDHESQWTFVDRELSDTIFIRGFVKDNSIDDFMYFISCRRESGDVVVDLWSLNRDTHSVADMKKSVNIGGGTLLSVDLPNTLQDIALLQRTAQNLQLTILHLTRTNGIPQLLMKTVKNFPSDVKEVSVFLDVITSTVAVALSTETEVVIEHLDHEGNVLTLPTEAQVLSIHHLPVNHQNILALVTTNGIHMYTYGYGELTFLQTLVSANISSGSIQLIQAGRCSGATLLLLSYTTSTFENYLSVYAQTGGTFPQVTDFKCTKTGVFSHVTGKGLDCWSGSTLGSVVGLEGSVKLVMSGVSGSAVVTLHTQAINVTDPYRDEFAEIDEMSDNLGDLLNELNNILAEYAAAINGTLETDDFDDGNWTFNADVSTHDDVVPQDWHGEGKPISGADFRAMLDRSEKEIKHILAVLKKIDEYMDVLVAATGDGPVVIPPALAKRIENVVAKELKLSELAELLEDLVLKSSNRTIETVKTFSQIIAEDLIVDTVNSLKVPTDLLTTTDEETIDGDVTYQNTLYAVDILLQDDSTINGVDLSQQAVYVGGPKTGSNIKFSQALMTSNMTGGGLLDGLPFGDRFLRRSGSQVVTAPKFLYGKSVNSVNAMNASTVTANTINKKPTSHLKEIVMKNRNEKLTNKHIEKFLVKENLQVEFINGVEMAGEFATKPDLKITGMKYFNEVQCGSVSAKSVNGEPTENIVIPSQPISINSPTHLAGGARFHTLLVSGFIDGVFLDASLLMENATLEYHTDVILRGDVHTDNMKLLSNQSHLVQLIDDLITKYMDVVELPGLKAGGMVANMSLETEKINGISPDSLMTTNTLQKWPGDTAWTFHKPEFKSLSADTINGVDTAALGKIILTDQTQEINHLKFRKLHLQNLRVQGPFIGELNFTEVMQHRVNQVIKQRVFVDSHVNTLAVDGWVHMSPGNTIAGLDVSTYAEDYLSLTGDVEITAHYTIPHADWSVKHSVDSVNNHPLDTIQSGILLKHSKEPQILNGKIKGLDLMSNTVTAKFGINNIPLKSWKNNFLWINKDQTLNEPLHFDKATLTYFHKTSVCGVDTKLMEDDALFKDGIEPVLVEGAKKLVGLSAKSDLNVKLLNDKPIDSILTKSTHQVIEKPWIFANRVELSTVNVTGEGSLFIKIFKLYHLVKEYYSEIGDAGSRDSSGNVVFTNSHFGSVSAHKAINGLDLTKFLEDAVNIFKPANITNHKHCTKMGSKSNVKTQLLNDEKLSEVISDLLLKNVAATLLGDIRMLQPVKAKSIHTTSLLLDGEFKVLGGKKFEDLIYLDTPQVLNELDLMLWDSAAVVGDLVVDLVNRVNMSNLVTLRTQQVLGGLEQEFSSIHCLENMDLTGFLDGINIQRWRDNTLNSSPDIQILSGTKTFSGLVLADNVLPGRVNGKTDFKNQVALLHEDQTLEGTYSFSSVDAENVIWPLSPLRGNILYSSQPNFISSSYKLGDTTRFTSISGDVLVDSVDLPEVQLGSLEQREESLEKSAEFWEHGMCADSDEDKVQESNVGYFTALGSVYVKSKLSATHTFQVGKAVYMIVSGSCADCRCTDLYHVSEGKLQHVTTLPVLGNITAWSSFTSDQLYLVATKLMDECATQGTVVYSIADASKDNFKLQVVQSIAVGGYKMRIVSSPSLVHLVMRTTGEISVWSSSATNVTFTRQPVNIHSAGKFAVMHAFGYSYIIVEEENYMTFHNMQGRAVGFFSISDKLTDILHLSSLSGEDNFIALSAQSSDAAMKCTTYVKILRVDTDVSGQGSEEFSVSLYDELYIDDVTSLSAAATHHNLYLMLLQEHTRLIIYEYRGVSGFVEVLKIPHPLASTVSTTSSPSVYTTISSPQTITLYAAEPNLKYQLHRSLCPSIQFLQELGMPELGNSRSRRSHAEVHHNASWDIYEGEELILNPPVALMDTPNQEIDSEVIDIDSREVIDINQLSNYYVDITKPVAVTYMKPDLEVSSTSIALHVSVTTLTFAVVCSLIFK